MSSTLLSTIIARMQRWQSVLPTEEQYLVYDLDEALRALKRSYNFPWALKKSTLKVFNDVLEYAMASDHKALAYIDNQDDGFGNKMRAVYTSLQEFYEDPTNRSQIAEIWDNGTEVLGIRYKGDFAGTIDLDSTSIDSGYTVSGDATTKALDTTVFKKNVSSLKVTVVASTSTATVERTFTAYSDTNYLKKYYFRWVYFDSTPTNVTLKLGTDSSNYLYKAVTTQFDGRAFKANDWNLVAFDLNAASTIGTFSSTSISYESITATGLSSGNMFLDQSSVKEWKLLDYWYYSNYMIVLTGATAATQGYFMDTNLVYSTDSSLLSPDEFVDVIMYEALISTVADRENSKIYSVIDTKRTKAWSDLLESYPDLEPLIINNYRRIDSNMDFQQSLNGESYE